MPKTIFEKPRKYDKLMTLIIGNAAVKGKSRPDIAHIAGIAESTIYTRFRAPENFTIDEILRLGRGLNIPIEELRQAITY